MRIGLITAYYDETLGGNEYYLAKELSKKHKVFIYVSKYTPYRFGLKKTNKGSKLKNVKVIRLDSVGIKKIGMLYLKGLKQKLNEDKIDIVHVQEWFMPLSLSCRKHKNLVLTQRLGNQNRISFLFKIYTKMLSLFFNKKTTKFTALTSEAKQLFSQLSNIDEYKINIIPNGVDINIFKPSKPSYRKKFLNNSSKKNDNNNKDNNQNIHNKKNKLTSSPDTNDTFVLLSVGRLHKEKGFDILIKACSRLDFNFKLVIIGSGSEKSNLEKLVIEHFIENKVLFIDKIPHNKMPEAYSSSDVVIIPSLNEPFGFTTIEALACGIPVIGSNIGGMKDVITKEVGIKVSPGKIIELRNAIQELHNKKLRDKLKKNTSKYVKNNYSWKSSAERYINIYKLK